jgi:hypothetical protein
MGASGRRELRAEPDRRLHDRSIGGTKAGWRSPTGSQHTPAPSGTIGPRRRLVFVLRPQLQRGQPTCQGIPAAQGSAGPGWNNTTRLSAECKDCGGDEVAGLTRRRVSVRSAAGGLVLCDASTREELFVGPRRTSRSERWPVVVCRSADNAANERLILPQLHARTTHQGCVTSQRLVSLVSSDGISVAHSLEGCVQSEGGCS